MFILLQNLEKIYHAINYRDVEWDHFCFDYVCWNFIFFLCFHCHKNCDLRKSIYQWFLSYFRKRRSTSLQIQWRENVVMVTIKSRCKDLMIHIFHSSLSTNHWLTRRWSHDTTSLYNVFIYFVFHWFTCLRVFTPPSVILVEKIFLHL